MYKRKKQWTYEMIYKQIISMGLLVVLSLQPFSIVHADKKDGWDEGYYYIDGEKQTSTWVKDDNNSYYLDSKGHKVTGWKKVGKSYYFFNEKGKTYNSRKKVGVKLTKLSEDVLTMGIDVSQWQGRISWDKVKAAGVQFAMLRVGYGKGRYGGNSHTMDKKFKEYVEGAKAAGIPIGIYFYSYATTEKQALSEAQYTIEQLDGVPVAFPIAYDIEDDYVVKHTTKAQRTAMAKTYMDTIAAAGYQPMFYCNQNWYDNYLNADELSDYDFWYARYTYVEPEREDYPCTIWQATSTQKINGIAENTVDIDFLYKDYANAIKIRTSALKYGWHKEDGELRYYYQGKPMKSGWLKIAGGIYYLQNNAAVTGWKTIAGSKYYFDSEGVAATGFSRVKGEIYLFDVDGVLQLETEEPGVSIDSDGVCTIKKGWYQLSNGKYFYRNADGSKVKNKWMTIKGKKYYCDDRGYRVTGFKNISGKRYYFNSDGTMKKGWLTYHGKKYYFKKSGAMIKGKTTKIKGKKYTFNKKGQLI